MENVDNLTEMWTAGTANAKINKLYSFGMEVFSFIFVYWTKFTWYCKFVLYWIVIQNSHAHASERLIFQNCPFSV